MPFIEIKSVFDYYTVHFSVLDNIKDFVRQQNISSAAVKNERDVSRITGTGFVKNSRIASSCTIEGYIENSILFSHVKVGKNARVKNSIIMDYNYIGNGAFVQNTILCDNSELFSRVTPNIGEESRIGDDGSFGVNEMYPEYIHDGITLIGQNVEIPKGYIVSRNCYIASNLDKSKLKGWESVKEGESVLPT